MMPNAVYTAARYRPNGSVAWVDDRLVVDQVTDARTWLAGARPRTLPAAIVPVVVGTCFVGGASGAAGGWDRVGQRWWAVLAAAVVSLALQVGTNYANDYSDGVRGTDDVRVGPMRLVASGAAAPGSVKRAAMVAFALAAVVGFGLAAATSWWLLAVGAASIAAGWFYTGGPRPYGYAGLGELFVFVFFGLVATAGTAFVVADQWRAAALVGGAVAGFGATALLVVNNLRDIPGDSVAGKVTLAVRLGDARTRRVYQALLVGAALGVPVAVVAAGIADSTVGLVILGAGFAVAAAAVRAPAFEGPVASGARGAALIPALADTARVHVVVGVALAIALALRSVA